jgi:hypothetical protein
MLNTRFNRASGTIHDRFKGDFTLRISVFLVTVLSTVSTFSAPREFCTGGACAPDLLAVRFGHRFGPTEFLAGDHVPAGREIDIVVTLDVESGVQAVAFGLATNPDEIEVLSAVFTDDLLELNPFFAHASLAVGRNNEFVADPSQDPRRFGIVGQMILPILPLPGVTLPPGSGFPLINARIRVIGDNLPIRLEFTNDLNPNFGAPLTITNFTIDGMTRPPREVEDGVIRFGIARRNFRRGDANGDGRITIVDPVLIAQNTFFRRTFTVDCDDMLDVDDDGQLTITDPVVILQWMFLGNARPAEPFMNCDGDETSEDGLACAQSNCS